MYVDVGYGCDYYLYIFAVNKLTQLISHSINDQYFLICCLV